MRIYVGGVNASGKSTILKKVSEISGYEFLHGAGLLMEHLKCQNDYEKLRTFTDAERENALSYVMQKLCAEKDNFVLDSHYMTLIRGEIHTITNSWLRGFDALVLISSPFEEVWNRLEEDSLIRDRALFPIRCSEIEAKKILAEYQLKTEQEFDRLKNLYRLPGIHIENKSGDIDTAISKLNDFIK